MHKTCKGECKESKPLTDYYFNAKHRSYFSKCKLCTNKERKAKRVPKPREPRTLCNCGEDNPEMFYKSSRATSGRQSNCKNCCKKAQRLRNQPNFLPKEERDHRLKLIRDKFKIWNSKGVLV